MRIQGTNQTNFNPYKNHMQKQTEYKKSQNQSDQLEISKQAKKLQENNQSSTERMKYVQEIKREVDSGTYRVDSEKTTKKMIDFWSRKR